MYSDTQTDKYDSTSNISNSTGDICRICHCEADPDNPLLSPCYCSGSLKYVHQSCLRQWLAASDTRSCELCKFNFILQTKIKPISEWRRLEMSNAERRRLACAILFHFVAAICVIWSLFVLIDRATEEVQKGMIAWPFWTKLVVVGVGFSGGAVFMYIQCRQYLHLFARWKAHNRIILVQNAPEKPLISPPSPTYVFSRVSHSQYSPQMIAHHHHHHHRINIPSTDSTSNDDLCYVFEKEDGCGTADAGVGRARRDHVNDDICIEDLSDDSTSDVSQRRENIREVLDLDAPPINPKKFSLNSLKTELVNGGKRCVFKSLPNLNTSNENLLV